MTDAETVLTIATKWCWSLNYSKYYSEPLRIWLGRHCRQVWKLKNACLARISMRGNISPEWEFCLLRQPSGKLKACTALLNVPRVIPPGLAVTAETGRKFLLGWMEFHPNQSRSGRLVRPCDVPEMGENGSRIQRTNHLCKFWDKGSHTQGTVFLSLIWWG